MGFPCSCISPMFLHDRFREFRLTILERSAGQVCSRGFYTRFRGSVDFTVRQPERWCKTRDSYLIKDFPATSTNESFRTLVFFVRSANPRVTIPHNPL